MITRVGTKHTRYAGKQHSNYLVANDPSLQVKALHNDKALINPGIDHPSSS